MNQQTFTQNQIDNWRAFEKVRQTGKHNMFLHKAREETGMSVPEWLFCMDHYTELKEAANQPQTACH